MAERKEVIEKREAKLALLGEFIQAAKDLIESADHTGCSVDLCVIDSEPLHRMKRALLNYE